MMRWMARLFSVRFWFLALEKKIQSTQSIPGFFITKILAYGFQLG